MTAGIFLRVLTLPLAAALAACGAQDTTTPAGAETGDPAAADVPAPAPPAATGAATTPVAPSDGMPPALNANEPTASECGADKLGEYLNTLPSDDIKARIAAAVGHDRIRHVAPGQPVTADLRPDRLNVETGADGRVMRFRCG